MTTPFLSLNEGAVPLCESLYMYLKLILDILLVVQHVGLYSHHNNQTWPYP